MLDTGTAPVHAPAPVMMELAASSEPLSPFQQQCCRSRQQQNATQPPTDASTGRPVAYADPKYWDARYERMPVDFEWFYGWVALRRAIRKCLPKQKELLHIGCGNSTLQRSMAEAGYVLTNVDLSPVLISQMLERDAHMAGLKYLVADCRDLNMFPSCHFCGALDKGTIDALLCCKEGSANVTRMCAETSRVLRPGASFLAITLGDPSQRLALLSQPQFAWTVTVMLLPRVAQESMVQAPGRTLPVNDTIRPITPLGPLEVRPDFTVAGIPEPFDPSQYFYVYVCTKTKIQLQVSSKLHGHLPESWCAATREAVAKFQTDMGHDLFSKGVRTRRVPKSQFYAGMGIGALRSMSSETLIQESYDVPGAKSKSVCDVYECVPSGKRPEHPPHRQPSSGDEDSEKTEMGLAEEDSVSCAAHLT